MRHAILMTAYHQPELINMTLDRFASQFDFYIHIDKKSSLCKADLRDYPNVYIFKERLINWGGMNHLLAFIDLMKIANQNVNYDFYHLITGQDIIVGTQLDFDSLEPGMSYISCRPANQVWSEMEVDARYNYYRFLDCFDVKNNVHEWIENKLFRIQKKMGFRRPLLPMPIYGGNTYCSLSADAVLFILKDGGELLERLNNTYIPEEIYFQTLLMSSAMKDKLIRNCKRLILWPGPKVLNDADYSELASGKYLFARKIDLHHSSGLLKKFYHVYK